MTKSNIYIYLAISTTLALFSSCVGLNIDPNEKIYWDNEVSINYDLDKKEAKKVTKKLKTYINPKPVRRTLGMRLKIQTFKPDSTTKKDSVKYGYLRQEPVVYSISNLNRGKLILQNVLNNQGYFNTEIHADTMMLDDLRVIQKFTIESNKRFYIARVDYHCLNQEVLHLIRDSFPSPYMKINVPLSPSFSDLEKKRIRNLLLKQGYSKAENIRISVRFDTLYTKDVDTFTSIYPDSYADTLTLDKEKIAIVSININHGAESDTLKKYYLDTTFVNILNFSSKDDQKFRQDTVDAMIITRPDPSIPLFTIADNVYGNSGDVFSVSAIKSSQRKLNQYGYFQSTENIEDVYKDSLQKINRIYTLKLNKMKSLGGSIDVYQSALGGGIQVNASYTNKNIGHRGIKFDLQPSISYDLQVPDENSRFPGTPISEMIVDRTFGAATKFSKPKIIFPGVQIPKDKNYLSETGFSLFVSNNNRTNTFNFMNYVATFGYRYKPSSKISYEINPLFCNITDYLYRSDDFQSQLDTNFLLKQTYSRNFILGEFVGFSVSNNSEASKTNRFLSLSIEEAGGIIQLIELLGADLSDRRYAKYFKVDLNTSILRSMKNSAVGGRLLLGSGFMRGDNVTLPYVKQYFVGGPYEMRGFRVRSIGPGSFKDTTASISNIYQTADIKIVLNAEYRFDIWKNGSVSLEGATFVDMGNIWTEKDDPSRPGSQFNFKTLYNDLAVSVGWGIRLNLAGLLLLRFDFGTRAKYPDYYDQNDGWIQNTSNENIFDFYIQNTTGQIGVGYPF